MQKLVSDIVDMLPIDAIGCILGSYSTLWYIRDNRLFLSNKPTITLRKSIITCNVNNVEHAYFLLPIGEYGSLYGHDMATLHKTLIQILDELSNQFDIY